MKKNIYYLTVLLLTVLATFCAHAQQTSVSKEGDDFYVHNFHGKPGEWGAVIKGDEIYVEFAGPHWNTGRQFLVSEFSSLPSGSAGKFTLQREAGTMSFEGVFSNKRGQGTYHFEEKASFKNFLAGRGIQDINNELMLTIFFTDINTAYFDYLKTNGYTDLTRNQLNDLAQQNITRKVLEEDFKLFTNQHYEKVSLEKIIELHEHGVDAAFVNSFVSAGYMVTTPDNALELRDHGVDIDFIRGFGVKDISLEQAVALRDHGVDPDYIKSLNELGWKDISLETATELRDHGVSVSFVKAFHALGYKEISSEKAKDLRDHGVDAAFISGFKAIGFKDITLDNAQELRDHGVTAAYIKKMQQKGLTNLSLSEYQKLRDAGM